MFLYCRVGNRARRSMSSSKSRRRKVTEQMWYAVEDCSRSVQLRLEKLSRHRFWGGYMEQTLNPTVPTYTWLDEQWWVNAFICCRNAADDLSLGQSVSLPEGSVPPLPARHHATVSAMASADTALPGSTMSHNLNQLVAEGFDEVYARRALKLAKNNIELARGILNEFVPSVPSSTSRWNHNNVCDIAVLRFRKFHSFYTQ